MNSSTSEPLSSANQRRLVAGSAKAENTRAGDAGYPRSILNVLWTTEP